MRFHRLIKTTVSLVIISFILPWLSFAFDQNSYLMQQPAYLQVKHSAKSFTIPKRLGRIQDGFQGTGKTVICIEDLHCNYEVQKNIAAIISRFIKSHKVKLVAEEGAFGKVDTSEYRAFPINTIKEAVCDYFVREGKLTGAEYNAITSKQPIHLVGLETPELYYGSRKAVETFLNSESQGYIYDLRGILEEIKTHIYNPALKKHNTKYCSYREGKFDTFHYGAYLHKKAQTHGINLSQYPNLRHYLNSKRSYFTPDIEPEKLFGELDGLDKAIRRRLYTSERQRELDAYYQRLDIVEKLLSISVTPEELHFFRTQREKYSVRVFQEFIQKTGVYGNASVPEDWLMDIYALDAYLKQVAKFYALADQRSTHFVENLLKQMEEQEQNISVMIHGGFHKAEVLAELKSRNITYLSIKPGLTKHDVLNPYFDLLQNKQTPLEKLLKKNQNIMALRSKIQDSEIVTPTMKIFKDKFMAFTDMVKQAEEGAGLIAVKFKQAKIKGITAIVSSGKLKNALESPEIAGRRYNLFTSINKAKKALSQQTSVLSKLKRMPAKFQSGLQTPNGILNFTSAIAILAALFTGNLLTLGAVLLILTAHYMYRDTKLRERAAWAIPGVEYITKLFSREKPVFMMAGKKDTTGKTSIGTLKSASNYWKKGTLRDIHVRNILHLSGEIDDFEAFEEEFKEVIDAYGYKPFTTLFVEPVSRERRHKLFNSALPAIKKMIDGIDGLEFKEVWPDLVVLGLAAGKNCWELFEIISKQQELITNKKEFIEIANRVIGFIEMRNVESARLFVKNKRYPKIKDSFIILFISEMIHMKVMSFFKNNKYILLVKSIEEIRDTFSRAGIIKIFELIPNVKKIVIASDGGQAFNPALIFMRGILANSAKLEFKTNPEFPKSASKLERININSLERYNLKELSDKYNCRKLPDFTRVMGRKVIFTWEDGTRLVIKRKKHEEDLRLLVNELGVFRHWKKSENKEKAKRTPIPVFDIPFKFDFKNCPDSSEIAKKLKAASETAYKATGKKFTWDQDGISTAYIVPPKSNYDSTPTYEYIKKEKELEKALLNNAKVCGKNAAQGEVHMEPADFCHNSSDQTRALALLSMAAHNGEELGRLSNWLGAVFAVNIDKDGYERDGKKYMRIEDVLADFKRNPGSFAMDLGYIKDIYSEEACLKILLNEILFRNMLTLMLLYGKWHHDTKWEHMDWKNAEHMATSAAFMRKLFQSLGTGILGEGQMPEFFKGALDSVQWERLAGQMAFWMNPAAYDEYCNPKLSKEKREKYFKEDKDLKKIFGENIEVEFGTYRTGTYKNGFRGEEKEGKAGEYEAIGVFNGVFLIVEFVTAFAKTIAPIIAYKAEKQKMEAAKAKSPVSIAYFWQLYKNPSDMAAAVEAGKTGLKWEIPALVIAGAISGLLGWQIWYGLALAAFALTHQVLQWRADLAGGAIPDYKGYFKNSIKQFIAFSPYIAFTASFVLNTPMLIIVSLGLAAAGRHIGYDARAFMHTLVINKIEEKVFESAKDASVLATIDLISSDQRSYNKSLSKDYLPFGLDALRQGLRFILIMTLSIIVKSIPSFTGSKARSEITNKTIEIKFAENLIKSLSFNPVFSNDLLTGRTLTIKTLNRTQTILGYWQGLMTGSWLQPNPNGGYIFYLPGFLSERLLREAQEQRRSRLSRWLLKAMIAYNGRAYLTKTNLGKVLQAQEMLAESTIAGTPALAAVRDGLIHKNKSPKVMQAIAKILLQELISAEDPESLMKEILQPMFKVIYPNRKIMAIGTLNHKGQSITISLPARLIKRRRVYWIIRSVDPEGKIKLYDKYRNPNPSWRRYIAGSS